MKEMTYRLSTLSCANCADKIEQKIQTIDGVEEGHVNFVTKVIKVNVSDSTKTRSLHDTIKTIVQDIEGPVEVYELNPTIIYAIEGLEREALAATIEQTLSQTEGILDATVDVLAKKLTIQLHHPLAQTRLDSKIQSLLDEIEPGLLITLAQSAKNDYADESATMSKDFIFFGIGVLLFIGALWLVGGGTLYYLLLVLSYLILGGKVVMRAFRNLYRGKVFDENFLMTTATMGAFAIGEHPEAVAVMIFYQIGEFFQKGAVNRSRRSIQALMSIRPDVATIKQGNTSRQMRVEDVQTGDIMIIKPGERIPLDGEVIFGTSTIDTKILTGESVPITVTEGEMVLSGCMNLNGVLSVKVTTLASESTVSKVLELVEHATSKKAPTETFITKFARVYTPIVTALAVLLAVLPPLLIPGATFEDWIYRALVFLVISCPCALVVSIPLGFFGGIGAASRNGILVKGGNYLEGLNHIEIAVFDKTGTLTEGTFTVTQINPVEGLTPETLLEQAAYVESFSNHPIAVSVVKKYNKDIDQQRITMVEELPGHGIKAVYHRDRIVIGNARMMEKEGIQFVESDALGSILYIAVNEAYVGNIVVSDQLKKDAKATIERLKSLGIKRTVMLTGDKHRVATSVGSALAIDEIYSELLPEDKLNIVETLLTQTSRKGKLFFVGDGINDTPVLARADIGIAMGGLGADAAIDVADVVIMNDEPSKIATAILVAKRTRSIVWQNIILALGIKVLFLGLGAIGIATMWEAVIADVGVSLLAVLNAMRVLKHNF